MSHKARYDNTERPMSHKARYDNLAIFAKGALNFLSSDACEPNLAEGVSVSAAGEIVVDPALAANVAQVVLY